MIMRMLRARSLLIGLAATPVLAWESRFGTVPGNEYGRPGNASFDYVVIGGGKYGRTINPSIHQSSMGVSGN